MKEKISEQRWIQLWKRLGAQGDARAVYDDLVARYAEPHRTYHTLEHIEHCLNEFESVRHLAARPSAVEWALWHHDAIYDTKAKDNEDRSAALAAETARNASLTDDFGKLITHLIMATKHLVVPTDPGTQLLVDIDLSILGQSEDRFDTYERQVREEYKRVAEDVFVARRSAILKLFLERPTIYSTPFFRTRYEAQAQWNLTRSLAQLSNRS